MTEPKKIGLQDLIDKIDELRAEIRGTTELVRRDNESRKTQGKHEQTRKV